MYPLRYFGDPVLKQRARDVAEVDADLVSLVNGMYDTMDLADGIGLAAPQVGVRKRLFTFDLHEGEGPAVVINPEIEFLFLSQIRARVGTTILMGSKDGLVGRYRDNSRFKASAS